MTSVKILTLFPEMFTGFLNASIIKRAVAKGSVDIQAIDIRPFTTDKNGRVDDYTVGGGAGLIMKCQPVLDCLRSVRRENSLVILTSPRGETFSQKKARELLKYDDIIIICGHYEGVDQRILKEVDLEISIGDYILTGGEIAAMAIADATTRLLDGAITHESTIEESFENGLLEYPQYSLPREYRGEKIPAILFSGNHEAIRKWRLKESLRVTKEKRPDLLKNRQLSNEERALLKEIEEGNETPRWYLDAVGKADKFTSEK